MKKSVALFILLISIVAKGYAQDVIIKKSHQEIYGRIINVTNTAVIYAFSDSLNYRIDSIPMSEVLLLNYNYTPKEKPIISDTTKKANPPSLLKELNTQKELTPEEYFAKGQIDAQRYYTGYRNAGTGTLAVTLLSPLVGLIPAIACSTTPPLAENLGYPNETLFQNPDYQRGYTSTAQSIKSRRVWSNWGSVILVEFVGVLVIAAVLTIH